MNIIQPLLQFQSQLKVWHWMTKSFSQHKAFGETYDSLSDSIDTFVETYFGRFGRENVSAISLSLKPQLDDKLVKDIIAEFDVYLRAMDKELKNASELLNIRDEILGDVDHLLYLLTLV